MTQDTGDLENVSQIWRTKVGIQRHGNGILKIGQWETEDMGQTKGTGDMGLRYGTQRQKDVGDTRLRTRYLERQKTDKVAQRQRTLRCRTRGQNKGHGDLGTCGTGQGFESPRTCDTEWGLRGTQTWGDTGHRHLESGT